MVRIPPKMFYLFQMLFGAACIFLAWYLMRPRRPESMFKLREADRDRPKRAPGSDEEPQKLADARLKPKKKAAPLALPGIRIDGAAHEILGIPPGAADAQIQKAYRELMKRYHPDSVGRPGSREWQDAQKIAHAINNAKDEMLKARKKS